MADTSVIRPTLRHNYYRAFSILATICLVVLINDEAGMTNALLSMVGVMIGVTLVLGKFGFTGGWAAWIKRTNAYHCIGICPLLPGLSGGKLIWL